MMNEFELGIRCDYLLSMANGSSQVGRDYFLGIVGDKIAAVAPWAEKPWKTKRLIDAKNKVVMPGLINGHTHLAMSLFRGLADDHPFSDWLFNYILPLEAKLVDPAFVRVGTTLAALESIRFGVTTVCDMYFFADIVADVLEHAGLRALVSEAITDFPSPDDKQLNGKKYEIIDKMREKYSQNARIIPCLGPHTPYTCSDETLKTVRTYSEKQGMPIVIHVSETRNEVEESLKKYSKTPVSRLFDLGILAHKTVCAHCVHVTDQDIELMAKSKASAIYNPESNMKLGAGVAPIPKLLRAGVAVGIGTDGAASNNDLSIFREMDSGAKLQKLSHENNAAITAIQILRLATLEGARALNIDQNVGSLEEGKLADIILVDLLYPHMQPVHDIASQLVYSATGMEVDTVICNGKILMENSKMQTLDNHKIYREASQYQSIIQASLR